MSAQPEKNISMAGWACLCRSWEGLSQGGTVLTLRPEKEIPVFLGLLVFVL